MSRALLNPACLLIPACIACLLLVACAPADAEQVVVPQETPSPAPTTGRTPGVVARRSPTPSENDMQTTHGVAFTIQNGVEGLVIDIMSETGIGRATIPAPTVGDATPIKLRLHLRGLEGWRFTFADTDVFGAVATVDGAVTQSLQTGEALDIPIDAASPYWMDATHVEAESSTGGYYELLFPEVFRTAGADAFTLSFVDFYR